MINKLILKNFESHKSSHFDFSPKVNFITGASDQGKSSVRRALSWVVNNRPSGNDFVKDGENHTSVMLQIDRSRIMRELRKTKKGNTKDSIYKVNRETYEAIRSSVPERVNAVCNMSDVNIQSQFEPFFLLSSTPGNVAKAFNNIMGLDIVSDILKNANSIVNKAKLDIEVSKQQKSIIEQKLEIFPNLDMIEKTIKVIQNKNDIIEQNQKLINKTERLIDQYQATQQFMIKHQKLIKAEKEVIKLQKLLDQKSELQEKVTSTKTDIRFFLKNKRSIKEASHLLKAESDLDTLRKMLLKRKEISDKKDVLKRTLFLYNKAKDKAQKAQNQVNDAENNLKNFKIAHPLCPTCGKEWK